MVTVEQTFIAIPGDDIAVISGTTDTQVKARISYGLIPGVYTEQTIDWVLSQPEIQEDSTVQYRITWTIENLRLGVDSDYFATVIFNDGSNTTEITWTQPGLNASPNDKVTLDNRNLTRLATVSDIATKGFTRGWLSNNEWNSLHDMVKSLQEFNDIVEWEDGR